VPSLKTHRLRNEKNHNKSIGLRTKRHMILEKIIQLRILAWKFWLLEAAV